MSPVSVGLLGIAGLFGLMILRTPVAVAMLLVGFFGLWVLDGLRAAGGVLLTESYGAVSNYSWSRSAASTSAPSRRSRPRASARLW
jgi:hypothetical protein